MVNIHIRTNPLVVSFLFGLLYFSVKDIILFTVILFGLGIMKSWRTKENAGDFLKEIPHTPKEL